MSDLSTQPPPLDHDGTAPPRWRDVWQAPALVGAMLLLAAGLAAMVVFKPKPDLAGAFHQAEQLVASEKHEEAVAFLNERLLPYLNAGKLTIAQRQQFHLLRARAVYVWQKDAGIDDARNHQRVVDEYLAAEMEAATLEPRDEAFLADSYLSLGRFEKARERAARLPASEAPRLRALRRRMVELLLDQSPPDRAAAKALLLEALAEPDLPGPDQVWAITLLAENDLALGKSDDAIARLLRSIPALSEADSADLGQLHLLLGRAYVDTGALREAIPQLERAIELLPESDEGRAEALYQLGRIDEMDGRFLEARERYSSVVNEFPETRANLRALLGLARVDGAGSEHLEESFISYARVIEAVTSPGHRGEPTKDDVGISLLDRFTERFASGQTRAALRFATLAEDLYGMDGAPPELLLGLAQTHRRVADEVIESVRARMPGGFDPRRLDPETREEIRPHLVAAGRYYREYANRVVIVDDRAHADALWAAADCFDVAGDQESSVALFEQFAGGYRDDPRQPEARFRIARAHQARGDYELAAAGYRGLMEESAREGRQHVGRVADQSYVPLAQVYLSDQDPTNDEQAERLLQTVLEGTVGGTESEQFRDALIELGRLYYATGRYALAITRLDEVIRRFPEASDLDRVRFRLADAMRLEAAAIERSLRREAHVDTEQRALESKRVEHLRRALALFERVRDDLQAADARRLTPQDEIYLRNAHFYLGDCAFDLGDYAAAIRYYDAARDRYPRDPASLVALMQIVSAYLEQGDPKRALTANERAQRFFRSLPPEVWDDPTLPMGRDDWERWLSASAELARRRAGEPANQPPVAASAPEPAGP